LSTEKVRIIFLQKFVWAKFWAIFSQTHRVTQVVVAEADAMTCVCMYASRRQKPVLEKNQNLCLITPYPAASRVARWFVFKPNIPILGKLWRVLQLKILVNFRTIWFILLLLKISYGHLVYFVIIWYIFPCFGILYKEKSGNPGRISPVQKTVDAPPPC
jgi:hypothetical protein